jgi:hypothetical protein
MEIGFFHLLLICTVSSICKLFQSLYIQWKNEFGGRVSRRSSLSPSNPQNCPLFIAKQNQLLRKQQQQHQQQQQQQQQKQKQQQQQLNFAPLHFDHVQLIEFS